MSTDRGQMGGSNPGPILIVVLMMILISMVLPAPVRSKLSDQEARELEAAMEGTMEALVPVVVSVVALALLVSVGLAVVRAARARKQYPLKTAAWSPPRRWVERTGIGPIGLESCINCGIGGQTGRAIRFGTERVLFGFVTSRTTVGAFDECHACAAADEFEYALRAERDDPPTPAAPTSNGGDGDE